MAFCLTLLPEVLDNHCKFSQEGGDFRRKPRRTDEGSHVNAAAMGAADYAASSSIHRESPCALPLIPTNPVGASSLHPEFVAEGVACEGLLSAPWPFPLDFA